MLWGIMKQVAIYARVSTGEQSSDNQLQGLQGVAERMGWQVVAEFERAMIRERVKPGWNGPRPKARRLAGRERPRAWRSKSA
jgi:DNA invertase Pin-like site-specific DNA recombinase